MRDLRTIILAAGKGTRMKSDIPKVLHKICGRPVIQFILDTVKAVGSLKTYLVLGHKMDAVKAFVGKDHEIVVQKKLLGTADAVRSTQSRLSGYRGDVLIVCGDTPLLRKSTLKALIRKHRKLSADLTLLTAVVHDPQGYGRIIRDPKARISAIREDKDAVGLERNIAEINVGVYCVKAKHLFAGLKDIKQNPEKKEFYLTDIIELFIEKDLKVETLETEDASEGLGINTREDISRAADILRRRTLKDFMLAGVTVMDPNTTFIDGSAKIGQDTLIRPFTFIEADVKIGSNCTIGPFAHVREGTKIGNHVEVGNFTEVVRTKIGDRTLMKHFSYLGDAVVGSQVNIGAGTVTANFDGANKNIARIGNNAFIGSDAVLISPVRIGRKATVGAGSVVTKGKNVADGAVVVGVPAVNIPRKRAS
jgi:bifunctional UDP-N-acetylglucosamine pyrophosphorylase/glucosamine-1-phosphate N-acetyltransferase